VGLLFCFCEIHICDAQHGSTYKDARGLKLQSGWLGYKMALGVWDRMVKWLLVCVMECVILRRRNSTLGPDLGLEGHDERA
jgi:hypothetical protein